MIDPKLYTLLEVVKHQSYTKAAQELSLTQPAVTQHIKKLEKDLGIKIFYRLGTEIKITNEGKLLIQYAKRNIALHENLKQAIIDSRKHRQQYTVGITHTAESNAVAEVLGRYSATNPGTKISIISDSINNLYEMLKNYEIDLAVVEGKVRDKNINSLLLDTDSLVLALSKDNPLSQKEQITLNELKNLPLILRRPSSGTRNLFIAHIESRNISLEEFNIILEVDNIATIKDLIRHEVGVSILSKSVCLDELRKGKLSVLPIEDLSTIREINILYHKDFENTDILESIIKQYNKVKLNYHS